MTNDAFFHWVKRESELRWALLSDPEHAEHIVAGTVPSTSTRWRPAWSEAEITDVEKRFDLRFPSSYRRMLRVMGGTTAMQLVRFDADAAGVAQRSVASAPGWLDARFDEGAIRASIAALPERLWPSVADESNSGYVFADTFGADPGDRALRLAAISRWLERAPRAWPLCGHRYLILDDSSGAAPVLSIWHSNDTIVYGANIEEFLLAELGLSAASAPEHDQVKDWNPSRVPSWGGIIS